MIRTTQMPTALLAAALVTSTPFVAFAAEDDAEEVVVIGNRTPIPLSETGTSITLLTEEDILDSQEVSVLELLRSTPGITVSRSGSIGTAASLRIRGAEPGQTLVSLRNRGAQRFLRDFLPAVQTARQAPRRFRCSKARAQTVRQMGRPMSAT